MECKIGRTMGASTEKWTSLDPCSGLSESDPKLYTNFKFHEIEIHKHLENIWIYKFYIIIKSKVGVDQNLLPLTFFLIETL